MDVISKASLPHSSDDVRHPGRMRYIHSSESLTIPENGKIFLFELCSMHRSERLLTSEAWGRTEVLMSMQSRSTSSPGSSQSKVHEVWEYSATLITASVDYMQASW